MDPLILPMTTTTTIAGLLPMAIGLGGRSEMWMPLANTIVWGLAMSTLLTLFIIINYGLVMTAIMQKIGARVGGRYGIPVWQNYIDLIKNYSIRSSITHGVMFYLGPVFRLTGGVGLLLFVPTIYSSEMFSNLSFAGDLILALYFIFFGSLGMALGAGESGHPYSAIGIARGLSQMTAYEVPFALAVISSYKTELTNAFNQAIAALQAASN